MESGRSTPPNKPEGTGRKSPTKTKTTSKEGAGARTSPTKGVNGRISPTKGDSGRRSHTKGDTVKISPTEGDTGRLSPTKDPPRSGRASPRKDKGRASSTVGDNSGRVSPTKDRSRMLDDSKGYAGTSEDKRSGRVSPSKDHGRMKGDNGLTEMTSLLHKDTTADRLTPDKNEIASTKLDNKGRVSPAKDKNSPAKSKLDSIRANLMDGGKNKPKNKRESLDRVKKTTNIKDKIAACKERDKAAPRTITLPKAPPKSKPKSEPGTNTQAADGVTEDSGKLIENGGLVPVNLDGEQFSTIEEEIQGASIKDAMSFWKEPGADRTADLPDEEAVDVDIKGKMTYWESPTRDEDTTTTGRDSPTKDSDRRSPVILGNVKPGNIFGII